MFVLVLGSGGREHALGLKLAESEFVEKVFLSGGCASSKKLEVRFIKHDFESVFDFSRAERIDLVVVGPEQPLQEGLVNRLMEAGIPCFGPTREAAELEWSKEYAKKFMSKYGIPTAEFQVFSDIEEAEKYGKERKRVVVKADELCSGKGVFLPKKEELRESLEECYKLSKRLVVEDFLEGYEVSVFALCNCESFICLPPAQDYKRLGDNNEGPNTGGMGAYAPALENENGEEMKKKIVERVLKPTLEGLRKEGTDFCGLLYLGLLVSNDEPYLLEYNTRFGDPETQAVLPLLRIDLFSVMLSLAKGERLELQEIYDKTKKTVCLVLASQGYPKSFEKGFDIEFTKEDEDSLRFAGCERKDTKLVTSGGRVLSIVASADSFEEATKLVYEIETRVHFKNKICRKDVGKEIV